MVPSLEFYVAVWSRYIALKVLRKSLRKQGQRGASASYLPPGIL